MFSGTASSSGISSRKVSSAASSFCFGVQPDLQVGDQRLDAAQLAVVKLVVARGLGGRDHLTLRFEVLDLDDQLPLGGQHAFELLPGGLQAPLPGVVDLLQVAQRRLDRLVPLEAVRQVDLDLLLRVAPAGVAEDVLVGRPGRSSVAGSAPCPSRERACTSAICSAEPLDLDFLLGDDVHVVADLGPKVLDHPAGAFDLELDRHGVAGRVPQAPGRRCARS